MSEQLFIRLGWREEQACHWLVWSDVESEIIASGVIEQATKLEQLEEYARTRPVTVFVCSSAVTLTSVDLPEKGQRQALKAVPFMLEEQLAQDISELHFCIGAKHDNKAYVAVVTHEQMERWKTWLDDAGIKTKKFIPDCLAIPRTEHAWSALQLGEQWLIRTALYEGMTVDDTWLEHIASVTEKTQDKQAAPLPEITAFTPMDGANLPWKIHEKLSELPMLVLAKGAQQTSLNLLSGDYQPKREVGKHFRIWGNASLAFVFLIAVMLINSTVSYFHYEAERKNLMTRTQSVYQKVYPGSNLNVNLIKKEMNKQLTRLQRVDSGDLFFTMLLKLRRVLSQMPEIKINQLRFDARKKEFRLNLEATDYAQVEKFQEGLKQDFIVESGSMTNREGLISGSVRLKEL